MLFTDGTFFRYQCYINRKNCKTQVIYFGMLKLLALFFHLSYQNEPWLMGFVDWCWCTISWCIVHCALLVHCALIHGRYRSYNNRLSVKMIHTVVYFEFWALCSLLPWQPHSLSPRHALSWPPIAISGTMRACYGNKTWIVLYQALSGACLFQIWAWPVWSCGP